MNLRLFASAVWAPYPLRQSRGRPVVEEPSVADQWVELCIRDEILLVQICEKRMGEENLCDQVTFLLIVGGEFLCLQQAGELGRCRDESFVTGTMGSVHPD